MKRYLSLVIALVIGAFGCRSEFAFGDDEGTNATPSADAGTGSTFLFGSSVMLDGSRSIDPDGSIRGFRWRLTSAPTGSTAAPAAPTAEVTTMTLDIVGTYVLELAVTDDAGATDISEVRYYAIGPVTTIDAGPDLDEPWRTTVGLEGSFTTNDPGFTTTYSWSFVNKPAKSSAALVGADTLTPSFFADAVGIYTIRLTATTPPSAPKTDDVVVIVNAEMHRLNYALTDAEYSKQLDRFVITSDAPPRLRLVNPEDGSESTLTLPSSPTVLSVDPSGLRAAVGHLDAVSIVNLSAMTLENTFPVASGANEVVFGMNNMVLCVGPPSGFNWVRPTATVNTTTGAVTSGPSTSHGYLRLHPDGQKLYATTSGSPIDVVRLDLSAMTITAIHDSPYHGHYPMNGVWVLDDGFSLISGSDVFWSSDNPQLDMTHRAALPVGAYTRAAAQSSAAHLIATLCEYHPASASVSDHQLRLYDDQTLAPEATISIPDTVGTSEGRFVAFKADGSKVYVLAQGSTYVIYEVTP